MPEQPITFTSQDTSFAGSLVVPPGDGPWPAALLIVGSGEVDRNSDHRKLPLGVTRELADRLAGNGVASLRFDKRGVGASAGDYHTTGFHDNVRDAAAALDELRRRPAIDSERIVLVGHSEGALIATELAAGGGVAGVVLLGGTAQGGEAVLVWQAGQVGEFLPAAVRGVMRLFRIDITRTQQKRLARIKASTDDVMRIQGVKLNAKWFREFMAYDPAPALASIDVPVLAITGSDDVQTDPGEISAMEGLVEAPFEGHVLDGMNHILRRGGPSPNTYKKQLGEPVDPRVPKLVLDWMARLGMATTAPDGAGTL